MTTRRRVVSFALAALVLVSAALLQARLPGPRERPSPEGAPVEAASSSGPTTAPTPRVPPRGVVPEPRQVALEASEPASAPGDADGWARLAYRTDLDALAPLGDGPGNAALYFRDFARDGARWGEVRWGSANPALLLEAEPWVDQARLSFVPELWSADDPTRFPIPVVHFLALAETWMARGDAALDAAAAVRDYRRVVRLGRLVLQDDADFRSAAVGLNFVRRGAKGLYERARREGDEATMRVAGRVVAESDGIKAARVAIFQVLSDAQEPHGWFSSRLQPDLFDEIESMALHHPRRFMRLEALEPLALAASAPFGRQSARARSLLATLAGDPDAVVAGRARWYMAHPVSFGEVARRQMAKSRLLHDMFP